MMTVDEIISEINLMTIDEIDEIGCFCDDMAAARRQEEKGL